MAVMTEKLRIHLLHYGVAVEDTERPVRRVSARPVMVISLGFLLAAMGLVLGMALGLAPVSFLTAFLGFVLALTGGTMTLIFCGEI